MRDINNPFSHPPYNIYIFNPLIKKHLSPRCFFLCEFEHLSVVVELKISYTNSCRVEYLYSDGMWHFATKGQRIYKI